MTPHAAGVPDHLQQWPLLQDARMGCKSLLTAPRQPQRTGGYAVFVSCTMGPVLRAVYH